MTIISIAVPCFVTLTILLLITYRIGKVLSQIFPVKTQTFYFSDLFFKTLAGTAFIAVLTALVCTGGKTIQWIPLLLLIFWRIENSLLKNELHAPVKSVSLFTKSNLALTGLICAMVFIWNCTTTLKTGTFSVDTIEKDVVYYADISRCLIETGNENTFAGANYANKIYHYPTPYHYFDLWFNGIVAKVAGLNYTLSLCLVIYSFFYLLLIFGLLSIIEQYVKVKWHHVMLSFLLLFVSGTYFVERVLHLPYYGFQMEGIAERFGNKLSAAACFAIASILLLIKKETNKYGFLMFLCLPAISISFAPAVYGGVIVYSLSRLFLKKEDKNFWRRLSLYTFVLILFTAAFYFLTKKNDLNFRFNKAIFEYTDLKSFSFFHIKFYLVEFYLKTYRQPFLFFANYLPFLLVIVFLLLNKSIGSLKNTMLLFAFTWCCGLFAFNTLYLMDDAGQLYTNPLILWHVLLAVSLLYLFFQTKTNTSKIIFGTVFVSGLLINCVNSWKSFMEIDYFENKLSEKYLAEVNSALLSQQDSALNGATFYDPKVYRNTGITYPLEYYCQPFIFNPQARVPYNLTSADIPEKFNVHQIEKVLSKSPFTIFLKQKAKGILKDESLMQLEFIENNDVKYLICPPNTQIDVLKYLKIKKTITDSLSGQRFLLLQ